MIQPTVLWDLIDRYSPPQGMFCVFQEAQHLLWDTKYLGVMVCIVFLTRIHILDARIANRSLERGLRLCRITWVFFLCSQHSAPVAPALQYAAEVIIEKNLGLIIALHVHR